MELMLGAVAGTAHAESDTHRYYLVTRAVEFQLLRDCPLRLSVILVSCFLEKVELERTCYRREFLQGGFW